MAKEDRVGMADINHLGRGFDAPEPRVRLRGYGYSQSEWFSSPEIVVLPAFRLPAYR